MFFRKLEAYLRLTRSTQPVNDKPLLLLLRVRGGGR